MIKGQGHSDLVILKLVSLEGSSDMQEQLRIDYEN